MTVATVVAVAATCSRGCHMPSVLFDGDYTTPQQAGLPQYESPFPADPKRYLYSVPYWQFDTDYVPEAIGTAGPYGGFNVGDSSPKSVGGGVVEYQRSYALVPDTRSEFESHVYSYQIVLVGAEGGITEIPTTTNSRVQFDYFKTDTPLDIDLPKAPRAVQILNVIYLLHDWLSVWESPSGTEVLAEDATLHIWKPGIYERKQRFIQWVHYTELIAGSF